MAYFKPLLFLFFACLFVCCAKDELTGDNKALAGKWRLVKTTDQQTGAVTYPAAADAQVVDFLEKGKYFIYKNGKKTGKGYTMISDDHHHLNFRAAGMELAKNEMTFKVFQPTDIHGDSLFLPDHMPAGTSGKDEIYVRQ